MALRCPRASGRAEKDRQPRAKSEWPINKTPQRLGIKPAIAFLGRWPHAIEVERNTLPIADALEEVREDVRPLPSDTYSQRVRDIMLAQPLNPLCKVGFSVQRREPTASGS